MPIPLPNLDDRNFESLMAEALSLIPRYDRTWTHHNATDPGITLLELFAWLSETVMYRSDQITDNHLAVFLKIMGESKGKNEAMAEAVGRTAVSLQARKRAITAADYEQLAMAAMEGIKPGLAGRAAAAVNRNLENQTELDKERPGHTSVLVFPNNAIEEALFAKIKKYVETGEGEGWQTGEQSVVDALDRRRLSGISDILGCIDNDSHYVRQERLPGLIRQWKEGCLALIREFLESGQADGLDALLAEALTLFIQNLLRDIEKHIQIAASAFVPAPILDYIDARKDQIVKEFLLPLTGKPEESNDFKDDAARIRTKWKRNIKAYLDGDISAVNDEGIKKDLDRKKSELFNAIQSVLLHDDGGETGPALLKAIKAYYKSLIDAATLFLGEGNITQGFDVFIGVIFEYKDRFKDTIKSRIFPKNPASNPVTLPSALEEFLKAIIRQLLEEIETHMVESIRNIVQEKLNRARLLTHRIHVIMPEKRNVGISAEIVPVKDAIWETVREAVRASVETFLNPIKGGPEGEGWPLGRPLYRSELYQVVESVRGVDYVHDIKIRLNHAALADTEFETDIRQIDLKLNEYFKAALTLNERQALL